MALISVPEQLAHARATGKQDQHPALVASRSARRVRRRRLWGWVDLAQLSIGLFLSWATAARGDPILTPLFTTLLGATGIDIGLPTLGSILAGILAPAVTAGVLIGAAALLSGFNRPSGTTVFNIKVEVGPRRHAIGKVKVSGQTVFGGFSATGAFWYLVVHCDEEMVALDTILLDDIPIELNGSNRVTTAQFQAVSKGFLDIGSGTNPAYSVWVQTFTPANPVPPPLAVFKANFPAWDDDHKLAGTTYSIVKIDPVDDDTKGQVYKWQQGAFRLGEPGVQLIATFGRAPDLRDPAQSLDDPTTWQPTRNLALIWAWHRLQRITGFAMEIDDLSWDKVQDNADICDEIVLDKDGVGWPRYAGGLQWDETRRPDEIEQMILAACDGVVLQDADGRLYCQVGQYVAPDLTLGVRDLMGVTSQAVDDGEAQLDGVQVTYIEPDYGYIEVPAAIWANPRYYEAGTSPNILAVTIDACQSHNQAVRLAKAIGQAAQPGYKLATSLGPRALLARKRRIVGLAYDDDFAGAHMIVSPVSIDLETMTGSATLVPVSPTTWDLLAGEEGDRPLREFVDFDADIPLPTGVGISAVPVAGSNGNSVRIEAGFDPPPSVIYSYEFDYSADGGTTWQVFETDMPALVALSPILDAGVDYLVHWRTVTSGGNYSEFSAPTGVHTLATASLVFSAPTNSQYVPLL